MKTFRILTQESSGIPPVSVWSTVEAKNLAWAKKLPGRIVVAAYEIVTP